MIRARGYSLLEVLIAAALLAMAMTLLLGTLARSSEQVRLAGDRSRAGILAQSLLSAPALEGRLQPGRRAGTSPDGLYHWQMDIEPYHDRHGNGADARSMLLSINLTVSWGEARGQQLRWRTLRLAAVEPPA
ncbi:prepilin-type N-terminal cleavage/methylation domain-containing protein [Pseudoxanthomonas koreensis]|uniref:prepilin-type N-terminal cleavage/methylation domain-containing protein n=1 Tax=Pseudoxanthomonas koreensis TaxID=266061 RepID=UPI0035A6EE21